VLDLLRIIDTAKVMDLLDEEIAELEEEIRGYKYEYKTAGPEDKRQLRQVITARSQTLNRLLDARNTAATAGIRS
jgi:hypothetical protein